MAFPDDGAEKRFGYLFKKAFPEMEMVTCGKKRDSGDPSKRLVVVKEGNCEGKHVVIVDDMIQTGGTLYECGRVLKADMGAASVSAFCTHGIFPNESWRRFATVPDNACREASAAGDRAIFEKIWLTNSNPTVVSQLPVSPALDQLLLAEARAQLTGSG